MFPNTKDKGRARDEKGCECLCVLALTPRTGCYWGRNYQECDENGRPVLTRQETSAKHAVKKVTEGSDGLGNPEPNEPSAEVGGIVAPSPPLFATAPPRAATATAPHDCRLQVYLAR